MSDEAARGMSAAARMRVWKRLPGKSSGQPMKHSTIIEGLVAFAGWHEHVPSAKMSSAPPYTSHVSSPRTLPTARRSSPRYAFIPMPRSVVRTRRLVGATGTRGRRSLNWRRRIEPRLGGH